MGSYSEMVGTPKEFALRDPVCQWLVDNRYWPELELSRGGYICDIFGAKFGPRPAPKRIPPIQEIIAVELKLHDIAGVLRQCINHQPYCERTYAAIPQERWQKLRDATKQQFCDAGVGILVVDGFTVRIGLACLPRELDLREDNGAYPRRLLEQSMWRRARRKYDASGFADLLTIGD